MRRRIITAIMRAMIRSESAITLLLLAELLAITNRYGSGSAATVSTYTRMTSRVRSMPSRLDVSAAAMLGISVVCVNRIMTAVVKSFLSTK